MVTSTYIAVALVVCVVVFWVWINYGGGRRP
jgi:hypothetical protein